MAPASEGGGEWPKPRPVQGMRHAWQSIPGAFVFLTWLLESYYQEDAGEFIAAMYHAFKAHDDDRFTLALKWEKALRAHLADSEITRDRAAELEQQAREDAE